MGKPSFSNTVLQPEDCLVRPCYGEKASEQIVPVPTDLSVVFEDEHVLVIDKPAGMPVHPSQGHYENTLANAIAWYFRNEETPFVFRAVNRLDRDTSGLILLAKNPYSSCILSDAVKDHAIHRNTPPSFPERQLTPAPLTFRSPEKTALPLSASAIRSGVMLL